MSQPDPTPTADLPTWIRPKPWARWYWEQHPEWRELAASVPEGTERTQLNQQARAAWAVHRRERSAALMEPLLQPASTELTLAQAARHIGVPVGTLRRATKGDRSTLATRLEQTAIGPVHWVLVAEVERYARENLGNQGRPRKAARTSDA